MREFNCLFIMLIFASCATIYAQDSTAQDSLQLVKILVGKDSVLLNDATRKAINAGTFIRNPFAPEQLKSSPLEIPIIKSFEGVTKPESNRLKEPYELPPSVYMLYMLQRPDTVPMIRKEAYTFSPKTVEELVALEKLTPRKATVDDPTTLRTPGAGGSFSAENILRTIFWPSHRAKKRNAKNANAWKTYNEYK